MFNTPAPAPPPPVIGRKKAQKTQKGEILCAICGNKICMQFLKRFQSYGLRRLRVLRAKRFQTLFAPFVQSKPPLGSCGRPLWRTASKRRSAPVLGRSNVANQAVLPDSPLRVAIWTLLWPGTATLRARPAIGSWRLIPAAVQSARGLAHSKTLRAFGGSRSTRQRLGQQWPSTAFSSRMDGSLRTASKRRRFYPRMARIYANEKKPSKM